jgi:hypothetical protein
MIVWYENHILLNCFKKDLKFLSGLFSSSVISEYLKYNLKDCNIFLYQINKAYKIFGNYFFWRVNWIFFYNNDLTQRVHMVLIGLMEFPTYWQKQRNLNKQNKVTGISSSLVKANVHVETIWSSVYFARNRSDYFGCFSLFEGVELNLKP